MIAGTVAASPRSWLYVPGHDERKHVRAATTRADAIVLDLEDAVPGDRKADARRLVAHTLATATFAAREVWVRINAPAAGSEWRDDLECVLSGGPAGIVIPKVHDPAHVTDVAELAREAPDAPVRLAPIVTEQAAGVLAMRQTLRSSPAVVAAFWGTEDLSADLRTAGVLGPDGELLDVFRVVRSLFQLETAAACVAAVDTPWLTIDDHDGLQHAARRSFANGFAGMQAIHPGHVAIINAAFTPTEAEVNAARQIVEASDRAGGGALRVAGAMIDPPHVSSARRVLALAATRGGDDDHA